MTRPSVTVVMPFAGDRAAAEEATRNLQALDLGPEDQLILADNSGTVQDAPGVTVIRATGERSPAHARNAGAAHAAGEWILFLDSDVIAPADLIDAYFSEAIDESVGALAGALGASPSGVTLAAQYGASRNFLDQRLHLAHPFLPRAVAANLLVRRTAFKQLGGFYEGLRAAEDTDFSWRLQQAGWRLEPRAQACVAHRYRETLGELRRQWRSYAAGRAWLARRYEGFTPEPAVARVLRRRGGAGGGSARERRFLAIDGLLALDELAGLTLSNRPHARREPAAVVLVAERFPAPGDPLVDFAATLDGARVEAAARPEVVEPREVAVDYREDDGALARALALVTLALRHPRRCLADLAGGGDPPLWALAPAVRRLERDPQARVHPLGRGRVEETARRLAALAGRPLEGG